MLHNVFIVATWLIAISGMGGAAAIVAAVVFLTPAVALPMISSLMSRFIACTRCVALAVFVVSTVFSYWVGREGEYKRGHTAAIAEIAAEDVATLQRAVVARSVWKECRARDGKWNQSTGECE